MNGNTILENGPLRLKICRHGPLVFLTTDQFIGRALDLYGEFSEAESELLGQIVRPGATVLEVGANIGSHTLCLAKAAGPTGRVLAFEPQRLVFQILCANISLNVLTNVHTYQTAVGRAAGVINVPALDPTAKQNFGGVPLGNWSEGEQVPVITIDSLKLTACNLIKVDVERMELDVLLGAEQTIRQFKPALYVENEFQQQSEALIRQILAWNYRLYWHFPPMFSPNNFFGDPEDVLGGTLSANMLCLHASFDQKLIGFREITDPTETAVAILGAEPH